MSQIAQCVSSWLEMGGLKNVFLQTCAQQPAGDFLARPGQGGLASAGQHLCSGVKCHPGPCARGLANRTHDESFCERVLPELHALSVIFWDAAGLGEACRREDTLATGKTIISSTPDTPTCVVHLPCGRSAGGLPLARLDLLHTAYLAHGVQGLDFEEAVAQLLMRKRPKATGKSPTWRLPAALVSALQRGLDLETESSLPAA